VSQTTQEANRFPRIPLFGAAALITFALSIAFIGRVTGLGAPQPMGKATAERNLRFEDRADGGVIVTDTSTNQLLDVMTGQNGFLRGTLRGFARTRRADQLGPEAPFRLTGYQDGRLTLSDPSTGRVVELEAFGSANEAVFVRLLTMKPRPQVADARR
jgi:putative photosynthetic complex assembly protein